MSQEEKNDGVVLRFQITSDKPKRLKKLLEVLRDEANKHGTATFKIKSRPYIISDILLHDSKKTETDVDRKTSKTKSRRLEFLITSESILSTGAETMMALTEVFDDKRLTRRVESSLANAMTRGDASAVMSNLLSNKVNDVRDNSGRALHL